MSGLGLKPSYSGFQGFWILRSYKLGVSGLCYAKVCVASLSVGRVGLAGSGCRDLWV